MLKVRTEFTLFALTEHITHSPNPNPNPNPTSTPWIGWPGCLLPVRVSRYFCSCCFVDEWGSGHRHWDIVTFSSSRFLCSWILWNKVVQWPLPSRVALPPVLFDVLVFVWNTSFLLFFCLSSLLYLLLFVVVMVVVLLLLLSFFFLSFLLSSFRCFSPPPLPPLSCRFLFFLLLLSFFLLLLSFFLILFLLSLLLLHFQF